MQRQKELESTHLTETLILALIWVALFASPLIVWNGKGGPNWQVISDTWIRLLPFLGLSLVNHFIFVPFLFFKKMTSYFIVAAVTLVLFMVVLDQIQKSNTGILHGPETMNMIRHAPPGNLPPILNTFFIALLIMGFDTGMRSIFKTSQIGKEREKLEKEKVKSELAFLRNQISPHFFMNTLNNIHSLIDLDSEGAKDAVIRLSKLMQHLLYDSELETIPLKDEITFIRSYIELMKLRVNEKVKVTLEIRTEDPGDRIPPMLFTSLIENAFKYGVSYRENSFVNISLVTANGKLIFTIANSIITGKKPVQDPANSGIGLENTRKRLDLLYSSRYIMDVSDSGGIFTVTLNLPL